MLKFKEIKSLEIKNTMVILSIASLILSFLIKEYRFELQITTLILLFFAFIDFVGRTITFIWLNFSFYLSKISNIVILGMIFFFLIIPYSVLFRIIKDKSFNKTSFKENRRSFSPKSLRQTW